MSGVKRRVQAEVLDTLTAVKALSLVRSPEMPAWMEKGPSLSPGHFDDINRRR